MRKLAELEPPNLKSLAKVVVEGRIGGPLTVRIADESSGNIGVADSGEFGVLEEATGSALNAKSISKAIGTLGNTAFTLSTIDLESLDNGVWCPVSWIKDTRRRALQNLYDQLGQSYSNNKYAQQEHMLSISHNEHVVDELLHKIVKDSSVASLSACPKISVLVRSFDQVNSLCTMIENMSDAEEESIGVSEIIVDFLEIEGIKAAVARIKETKKKSNCDLKVIVASPRVIKPGEEGIWRTLLKQNPDGILVRSTGLLHRLTQLGGAGQQLTIRSNEGETIEVTIPQLIGDFSLNAANAITAYELLQAGLSRITAAYDLSANAITELATLLGKSAQQLEVVVHQHMPIFHTEHCVSISTFTYLPRSTMTNMFLLFCFYRFLRVSFPMGTPIKTVAMYVPEIQSTYVIKAERTTWYWLTWAAETQCSCQRHNQVFTV